MDTGYLSKLVQHIMTPNMTHLLSHVCLSELAKPSATSSADTGIMFGVLAAPFRHGSDGPVHQLRLRLRFSQYNVHVVTLEEWGGSSSLPHASEVYRGCSHRFEQSSACLHCCPLWLDTVDCSLLALVR